jgi:hypothetical protein
MALNLPGGAEERVTGCQSHGECVNFVLNVIAGAIDTT